MSNWSVALGQAAAQLKAVGLEAEHYVIPDFSGYQAVTGSARNDVHCLEVRLGPACQMPGYTAYAVAQAFDPAYPSMALVTMIERKDADGTIGTRVPIYNPAVDGPYSNHFMVTMHSALNVLDPTGQGKGQLVQSYHTRLTWSDLVYSSVLSIKLLRRFKKDGQLAEIAADFDDALMRTCSVVIRPFARDLHFFPRTEELSTIHIPLRARSGGPHLITNNSTALDQGFAVARRYLDEHTKRFRGRGAA